MVQPSLIPYSVNAPLWSDGAIKSRFLALPSADSRIDFTGSKAWGLPEKTVLVHAEQGLGDTLQFIRYLPEVAKRVKRVVLRVQAPLASLLGEAVGYDELWVEGEAAVPFDQEESFVRVPEGAGLGIEVDEAFAAELTSREEPHGDTQLLRRRDGSRTNS